MLGHKRLRNGQLQNSTIVKKDSDTNNNLNDKCNEKKQPEILPLKLEIPLKLELPPMINIPPNHNNIPKKEPNVEEETTENKKHIDILNGTPLAVPMVADTLHKSVTRNDAKKITETRLKKLKALSQKPEEHLSNDQKAAKKRIIRLEKNRRAASMSRRKKKMYIANLEQKYALMEKHLAVLQMENLQLKSLLNSRNAMPQMHIPNPNIPYFPMPNIPNMPPTNTNPNFNTNNNSSESLTSSCNSEPAQNNSMTPALSCENSSDISVLEPPLPINTIDPWFDE